MATNKPYLRPAEEIEDEIRALTTRLAQLQAEQEKASSIPPEPPAGAVIKFHVQFDAFGTVYTYVAYRFPSTGTSVHWVITGKKTGQYTWAYLINLMGEDFSVRSGARGIEFYEYTEGKWHR